MEWKVLALMHVTSAIQTLWSATVASTRPILNSTFCISTKENVSKHVRLKVLKICLLVKTATLFVYNALTQHMIHAQNVRATTSWTAQGFASRYVESLCLSAQECVVLAILTVKDVWHKINVILASQGQFCLIRHGVTSSSANHPAKLVKVQFHSAWAVFRQLKPTIFTKILAPNLVLKELSNGKIVRVQPTKTYAWR